ncbi:MAG: sugar phosphate isomerase/epimerase [Lachnospiraceae bacterium]|nr:sugar phosphate isomerase/epimerase [Lachnospiraceae bacterium]
MKNYDMLTGFADEITQDLGVQIESLQKLDMKYVEMRGVDGKNLIHHDNEKVREIKKRLEDGGIALSALGSPLGKIGINDPFEPHFEEFKRAVEIAHMMDAHNIRMFSFYVPNTSLEIKEQVFERLGMFSDYAKNNGVCLLHENEKGIYGEKAKECKEIMDVFGGEHFKAIFDFANFVQAEQDTLEAYELLKNHIAYVHVKDAIWGSGKVVPAGYGDGNLGEILQRMFDKGFNGFLSLEPHLFDFDGFAGLERGRSNLPTLETGKKLNGFEAFQLSHDCLLNVLDEKKLI